MCGVDLWSQISEMLEVCGLLCMELERERGGERGGEREREREREIQKKTERETMDGERKTCFDDST